MRQVFVYQYPEPRPPSLGTYLVRFAINAAGLFLASELVPGVEIGDWQSLLAGTAIFAIVNMLLRPLALFLSCCLVVATFGLFVLVVNALMLELASWAAGRLGLAFHVDGFWAAILGALVISCVSLLAQIVAGSARVGRS
ncbi:MAG: phage holin family protein [Dehalococcoidia bacterium]|nr:phage holin family protein [Dehalococcoidia bacterium]